MQVSLFGQIDRVATTKDGGVRITIDLRELAGGVERAALLIALLHKEIEIIIKDNDGEYQEAK